MSIPDNDDQHRAAKAEAKEQRDRDAARAMQEYNAHAAALQARSARLRELRLAEEAARSPAKKMVRKSTPSRTKVKR